MPNFIWYMFGNLPHVFKNNKIIIPILIFPTNSIIKTHLILNFYYEVRILRKIIEQTFYTSRYGNSFLSFVSFLCFNSLSQNIDKGRIYNVVIESDTALSYAYLYIPLRK
ncbi:MAG: hypothetical protein IPL21_14590 [Saprospirales bacterium]|nr:hypothetical protein [Saprospirales bacterium]